jgi:glycosyltransferase involved in cell wall biosynthesis
VRALAGTRPIDAYFFHTHTTALGTFDLMRQRPVVISIDATPRGFDAMAASYDHATGGPLDSVKHALTRTLFRRATALVTWSAWAKRSLVNDYRISPERVTVIPPGTQLDLWTTDRPERAPGEPVRVLFVGGDFRRKGGYDLLEACAPLLPDRCELHVVTRTPPPDRPGLHVHTGVQPNSAEMRRLYAHADIFALPTYGDCLAMVIMEAMAAGLPVVTTPVGGMAEAVREGTTGYLVQPGDVANLRGAIEALIAQPARRRAMGAEAVRIASDRFDAAANARRVRDLLLEIVASPRPMPA